MSELPRMHLARRSFAAPVEADVAEAARRELKALELERIVRRGQRIGITVGSRGVQNLPAILGAVVAHLRSLGAEPCLLAAMGSHGGGTEDGQRQVLASLGITESAMGAPVVTCADSEAIGATPGGLPVFALRSALALDGILPVNRVKPHTSFKGRVESGLVKMLVVGVGGPRGAQQFHGFGPRELPRLLVELGEVVLAKLPILGGLAIVENAYEQTARVQAIRRAGLIDAEAKELEYARSLSPSLPAEVLDLLVVQEMGKNYSGTGIDTNVVGRARIHGVPEPERPDIQRIAVLDLSAASHGNASGVGMADFVTRVLVDKIDRQKTYLNCLTSTFVVRAAIPMWFDTERELMAAAFQSLSGIPPRALRLVIIPNTLFLAESYVSEALVAELSGKPGLAVDPSSCAITFDAAGRMSPRIPLAAHAPSLPDS
jgi:hypothetical protein